MYDYLIRNAVVLDGSGADAVTADLAIQNGTITAIGDLPQADAAHTIDAAGRCLTPGFIDIHRHADAALFRPDFGKAELAQGLTTIISGNCGLSLAPVSGPHADEVRSYLAPIVGTAHTPFPTFADYRAAARNTPLRLNAGMLAGMGTLRSCIAGFEDRPLTDAEYNRLHAALRQALDQGALGVSLGLGYAPECFYSTEALIQALEPLKNSGTVITVHMRQEGDAVVDSLREMLAVARALNTPVEISHLKAIGKRNWHKAVPEMLSLIADARREGLDVACDAYPYPAGSTQLIHILPPEFQAGGTEALTAALQDPNARAAMRRRMEQDSDFENINLLVGLENVRATSLHLPEHRSFEGKSITDIAAAQGKDPFDALFDLLAAERCQASMIDFIAAEEDIDAILSSPLSGIISDSTYPEGGLCHRRVYGTYPRLLETYVKERGLLTLPQAIHKITRRPADRFGLTRKGRIEVGADADLCLFDLARIHEVGTWEDPQQLAEGMDYVFVGGMPAIAEGRFTDHFSGTFL